MKIVTLIPSFRPNIEKLSQIVSSIHSVSDVYVFSPDKIVQPIANWVPCDASLRENLVFEPRKWIQENLNNFDCVFYNEDDILVTGDQLKTLTDIQSKLKDTFSVGLIRYELLNGKRMFIDLHPEHSIHTGGNGSSDIIKWKNNEYFQPWNVHSGNFLLSSNQAKSLIRSDLFDTYFGEHGLRYCGCLESGASSLYRTLTKMIPIDYNDFCVQHLSTKYGAIVNTPTDETLNKILK
jgi:hypothetical protein